jgi:DNA repair protein RecO (recombination protein O)
MMVGGPATAEGVLAALAVTGHFLEALAPRLGDRPLPAARARLVDALRRAAA